MPWRYAITTIARLPAFGPRLPEYAPKYIFTEPGSASTLQVRLCERDRPDHVLLSMPKLTERVPKVVPEFS